MSEAFRKVGGQGFMTSVGVFVEKKKNQFKILSLDLTCTCLSFFQLTYISIFVLLITYISIFTNDTYFYLYS